MLKHIKQNFAPFLFATIIIGLLVFSVWSHFSQDKELKSQIQKIDRVSGEDVLVGVSTLFAQNASVQLNFEVLGTYASTSGNLSFNGEIMPDGATCSNGQILKKTGANDWDCVADATGSVASNSLNFDEFQNPLVLDANITVASTSNAYTWAWGGVNLSGIGTLAVNSTGVFSGLGSSSFAGSLNISKGLVANTISGAGLSDCFAVTKVLRFNGNGNFSCGTLADADIPDNITITNLSGTNTGDVTLAGTPNYLTLAGQQITLTKLDISDDTNMTAGTDLTLTTNDLTLDSTLTQAFSFTNTGSQSMSGSLNLTKGFAFPIGKITASGNVGVGTTSPKANLEIVGTASVSSNFTVHGNTTLRGSTTTIGDSGGGDEIIINSAFVDFVANGVLTLNSSNIMTSGLGFVYNAASGASLSLNFEALGYASASQYFGSAFGQPVIDCNDNAEGLQWSGGLFTCRTWVDADIPDGITINGGVIGSNNISAASTWTTLGTLTIGDGGDRVDFATDTWDVANGIFTGLTLGSLNVSSAATWTTLGTLTIGDNGDAVNFDTSTWDVSAGVFSGVAGMTGTGVYDFGGATSFEIPNSTGAGPTLDTAGEIGGKTASTSAFFGHFDGTTAKAVHDPCPTYYVESPTSANQEWVGQKRFTDPFTITEVMVVASGSNSAGWNLRYGAPGSQTTSVFTLNKSASASSYPTYTSFANSTILDKNVLSVVITSASATLHSFSVSVCGYYPR